MIRWGHRVVTLLVLGVGIVHTLGTFAFFDAFAEPAIWFSGSGLAGIFISVLNAALWREDRSATLSSLVGVCNCLFAIWLVCGAIAMPGWPPIVIAAIGVSMAILGLLIARQAWQLRTARDPA